MRLLDPPEWLTFATAHITRALSLPPIYFLEHSFWKIHVSWGTRLLFFLLLLVLSKMSRSHNKNPLQIFFKHENPHFVLFLLLALSSRSRHLPTQQEVLYLTPPDSSDSESQNEKLYIFLILFLFWIINHNSCLETVKYLQISADLNSSRGFIWHHKARGTKT